MLLSWMILCKWFECASKSIRWLLAHPCTKRPEQDWVGLNPIGFRIVWIVRSLWSNLKSKRVQENIYGFFRFFSNFERKNNQKWTIPVSSHLTFSFLNGLSDPCRKISFLCLRLRPGKQAAWWSVQSCRWISLLWLKDYKEADLWIDKRKSKDSVVCLLASTSSFCW